MQGTGVYYTACTNPASEWGSCNTCKGNAHVQVSRKLPLRNGCVYCHTACTQRKCACQFLLQPE